MNRELDAVVIGAGFAGLYMLHRLRRLGHSAVVIEKAADVGGTWWWNRYPGARCDVESLAYSYSWDPELEQEWTWSERYAPQPEILAYFESLVPRFGLERFLRLNTPVNSATWDDATSTWRLVTGDGEEHVADVLVSGLGQLNVPNIPDIDGLDTFDGTVFHSAFRMHMPHALAFSLSRIN